MAHICGCGFYTISVYWNDSSIEDDAWIEKFDIFDKDWTVKYIYSTYFCIITMITVGYGDIYPVNVAEKIYIIFVTLFSCGVFAYCVN
jgi:hypothetical protein